MLAERVVLLADEIDQGEAERAIAQLLFLEAEDAKQDVTLHICSPGGEVASTFAIIEALQHLKPRVGTVCIGQVGGVAGLLAACGTQGMRVVDHRARVTLTSIDVAPDALPQLQRLNVKMLELLCGATGKSASELITTLRRERTFSPAEAVAFGLADGVSWPKGSVEAV